MAGLAEREHVFDRLELLDRAGMPPFAFGSHTVQRVGAFTAGLVHDVGPLDRWALGIGGDMTVYSLEPLTRGVYGDNPLQFRAFVRLRPPTMGASGPGGMMMEHAPAQP